MSASVKQGEIVKVQRALFPRDAPGLVYDRKSKHCVQMQIPEGVKLQMGGEPKAFFRAHWTGATWDIRQRVGWQSW